MPLPDLATLQDLQNRIGRDLTVEETRLASTLLRDASAAVRLYTGQTFTRVVDDAHPIRVRNGRVKLPQRPAISVASVTATALDQTLAPIIFWWDGLQTIILNPNVPNWFAWEPFRHDVYTVIVTYTHGYADGELPPALVGLVTQITGRALGTELIQSGITTESIAGYSYGLGAAAAAGGFGLLPAEKDALDHFRRVTGSVTVGPST